MVGGCLFVARWSLVVAYSLIVVGCSLVGGWSLLFDCCRLIDVTPIYALCYILTNSYL